MNKLTVSVIVVVALALATVFGFSVLHKGDVVKDPVGAVTGPDFLFPYFSVNGVAKFPNRVAVRTATTTICAIKSPAATSTLVAAAVRLTVASSTATIIDVARATTAFATTTAIGTAFNITGGAQATINASTSPAAGAAEVFPPNTFFVVGARAGITSGDTAGTGFVPVGSCTAEFLVV